MTGTAVRLVVVAVGLEPTARQLFGGHKARALPRAGVAPPRPFEGALFGLFGSLSRGDVVGLVIPGVWRGPAAYGGPAAASPLLAVRDHVNLALRGPLTGRWPAGVPRSFPCLTGIYQPAVVRALGGASVYSEDVVVAGVADAGRLTPFELGALDELGAAAYADCLVPAVVVAAFHGLRVAACVVPQAARERE